MTDDPTTDRTDPSGSSESTGRPDTARDRPWVELVAAILLGVAGILTAFAAYNAALTDGDALQGYTESAQSTADANFFFNKANQSVASDQAIFLQYQLKVEADEQAVADVIRDNLFSPELQVATDAFDALPASDETPTPLDTEEYVNLDFDEAERLSVLAEQQFAEGKKADDDGDTFELASVFLAVSLFMAGIASLFSLHRVRVGLLLASVGLIVPGVIAIMSGSPTF